MLYGRSNCRLTLGPIQIGVGGFFSLTGYVGPSPRTPHRRRGAVELPTGAAERWNSPRHSGPRATPPRRRFRFLRAAVCAPPPRNRRAGETRNSQKNYGNFAEIMKVMGFHKKRDFADFQKFCIFGAESAPLARNHEIPKEYWWFGRSFCPKTHFRETSGISPTYMKCHENKYTYPKSALNTFTSVLSQQINLC